MTQTYLGHKLVLSTSMLSMVTSVGPIFGPERSENEVNCVEGYSLPQRFRSFRKGQIFSTLAQISTSLDIRHRAKRAGANHRRSQLKVPLFLLSISH